MTISCDLEGKRAAIGVADQVDRPGGLTEPAAQQIDLLRERGGERTRPGIVAVTGDVRRDDLDACRRVPREDDPIGGRSPASNEVQ